MTDYRKLCIELFGTDDEDRIREIAAGISKRRSGRKPMFEGAKLEELYKKAAEGMSVNELAEEYGTSRQVISKYLNSLRKNRTAVRLVFMYKQFPCTVIDADYLTRTVSISNRTDDIMHRAFGVKEEPTWEDYEEFLVSRCYPHTRPDIKLILEKLGIDSYDPYQMICRTEGRTYDDDQWIRIRKGRINAV